MWIAASSLGVEVSGMRAWEDGMAHGLLTCHLHIYFSSAEVVRVRAVYIVTSKERHSEAVKLSSSTQ